MSEEKNLEKNSHPGIKNLRPHRFTSEDQPEGRGRPKGALSLTNLLRKELTNNKKEKAIELMKKIIANAGDGNATHSKLIFDRIDGVLDQTVNLGGSVVLLKPDEVKKPEGAGK